MKSKSPLSLRRQFATRGLLLAFALFAWGAAGAQNSVKNPDFEDPLGPDNWTIVYTGVSNSAQANWPVECGPSDFLIKGRIRLAHKDLIAGIWDGDPAYWSRQGGCFQAGHDWQMHAYFKQVVTNLSPFASYTVSARMAFFDDWSSAVQVYMEVLGGVAGNISRKTPYVTGFVNNNPSAFARYAVTNTANSSGQLEIRLHYNKYRSTAVEKWRNMEALYDHVTVLPLGETEDMPPYTINSIALASPTTVIGWETLSNHVYGVETTTDLLSGTNWSWAKLFLVGTGNNLTFTNNAGGGPQYFRIRRLSPYE
jgi:hypothetical protein